eukprot:GHRR01019602.1.p1 GENE.GHRR01019602.1~~GHRR01019602.1.p1  ORF type:complete len:434 (+),score=155.22 GHRR01019602.1:420-1721(+)
MGSPAKVMYAAVDKDRVYGPYSLKFQVIVKNLSEEVDVSMLFDFFSKFGEIYQCKTDIDVFGQYYGQVTYMDEDSVEQAVAGANQICWHSSVLLVEPHHKAHLAHAQPGPSISTPDASSSQEFPIPGAASSNSGSVVTSSTSRPQAAQQQQQKRTTGPPSTSQQQQQAQRHKPEPQSLFTGPVNFALQAMTSNLGGNDGSVAGGGSLTGALPAISAPVATPSAASQPAVSSPLSSLDVPVPMPFPAELATRTVGASGDNLLGGNSVNDSSIANGLDAVSRAPGARLSNGASVSGDGSSTGSGIAVHTRLGPNHLLHLLDRTRVTPTPAPAGEQQGKLQLQLSARLGKKGGRVKGGTLRAIMQGLEQLSEALCCPITHEVFRDPVVAADGISYERSAIEGWLVGHDTSPMTNMQLPNKELHPNNLIKTLVEELL